MDKKETRENITRILILLATVLAVVSLSLNLLTIWLEQKNHPQGRQDSYQETSIAVNIMVTGQVDYVSDGMETDISLLVESVPNYDYAVLKQRTLVPSEGDTAAADALAWVGFDAVCLADEHALDLGKEGVEASINYWTEKKLMCAGTNLSTDQQNLIRPADLGGITVVTLSFTEALNEPLPEAAHYLVNLYDPQKSPEIVRAAAEQADVVIVSIDWWQEYGEVTDQQKETAKTLADAGASIIVGSAGPNVLPVCWIDDTLVFYGTGNLMSDDLNAVGLLGAVTVSKSTLNDRTRVELTNPRVEVVCSMRRSGKFNVLAMTDVDNPLYRKRYEEVAEVLHSMDDSIRLGGLR
ncbi:MAG: CapA family protein [Solobacterium sp.]|nr:CapA family protein [Solobacterium sp.]